MTQFANAANIKCWQNEQNIRECGETVPPEYVQQRIEILNNRGMVVRIIEARKTEAQLAEEARQAKLAAEKQERHRQGLILLKTFAKEQDLLSTRDKQLAAIDSNISITRGSVHFLNNKLAKLQKQAANHERAGTKIPKRLLNDIAAVEAQIAENEKRLVNEQRRRQEIENKFAADLDRYREMKKLKPR